MGIVKVQPVDGPSTYPPTEMPLQDASGAERVVRRARPRISSAQLLSPWVLIADVAVIVTVSVLTGTAYHLATFGILGDTSSFVGVGLLVALVYVGITRIVESHAPFKISRAFDRARDAMISWGLAFLLLLFIAFVLKAGESLSRGATISFYVLGLFAVATSRTVVPVIFRNLSESGFLTRRDVIVVGVQGARAPRRVLEELRGGICPTPIFIGCDAGCSDKEWTMERRRITQEVIAAAHRAGPGEIFVSAANLSRERVNAIVKSLALVPRTILIIPDDDIMPLFQMPMTMVGENVAVEVQRAPLNRMQRAVKRSIDLSIASVLTILSVPLLALIALAVRVDSPGPIIFRQTRNGYRGCSFKMIKFRTMTVLEDGANVKQAEKNDARVTRVGRFLRRTSLDELPQLYNVLKGEMSLVGPRPHAVTHDNFYSSVIENYEVRQHVLPGITGWAQVNGLRGETRTMDSMYRRIEFDLWYAMHSSIRLDLQILARTIFEVFRQRNAY